MRALLRLFAFVPVLLALDARADEPPTALHLVAVILDTERDYPEAHTPELLEGVKERTQQAIDIAKAIPKGKKYLPKLEAIAQAVTRGAPVPQVERECGELAKEIIRDERLTVAPPRFPDLERGKRVYATSCAACHGEDGHARNPLAMSMQPFPPSFHDPTVMNVLSPFRIYATVRFGVMGTAMPGFELLSDPDRWAVSFYVMSMRLTECVAPERSVPIQELAVLTDEEFMFKYGPKSWPCLRHKGRTSRQAVAR